ncbi:unnamed protein product [Musa acuminata var. zebrina]
MRWHLFCSLTGFVQDPQLPYLDVSGKRFRFGSIGKEKVIVVMTGLSMLNAGLSTQLLLNLICLLDALQSAILGKLALFLSANVLEEHFLEQLYGDGPNDELGLESNGDYTRKFGYLDF